MEYAPGNLPGPNRALEIQVPCIIFFILTPLFLTIRLWSRLHTRSGLGWDDWTILVSATFCIAVSALMMASCYYGFGQHISNLSVPNKIMTLKLFYVAQAFYKLTINLTKASILLLYLRIFPQKWFKMACYALLSIVCAYMIATFCAAVWQCTPISRAWDKTIPGTCIDITENWYANAGFSIATDIIILMLPMQPLYASKLPTRQKIALMAVFALGIFVTVTSILRMQTLSFSSQSPDTTYDLTSSIWTIIEDNVAIICACLPMCRAPLAFLFPAIFSTVSSKSRSYGDSQPFSATHSIGTSAASKNDGWEQLHTYPPEKAGIPMTSITSKMESDSNSEEHILSPRSARSAAADDSEAGLGDRDRRIAAIRKTTQVQVSYTTRAGPSQ